MGATVSVYLPERLVSRLRAESNQSRAVADALEMYFNCQDTERDDLANIGDRLARIEELLRSGARAVIVESADEVDAAPIDRAMSAW